jgi:hypothetical protein
MVPGRPHTERLHGTLHRSVSHGGCVAYHGGFRKCYVDFLGVWEGRVVLYSRDAVGCGNGVAGLFCRGCGCVTWVIECRGWCISE